MTASPSAPTVAASSADAVAGVRAAAARVRSFRPPLGLEAAVLGIAAAALGWLRLPEAARATPWADDIGIFLAEAWNDGAWASVFHPYAGYLHVGARLLTALVTQLLPLDQAGVGLTVGSVLIAGVVAALVYVCTRDLIPWRPARAGLALITVVAPLLTEQVLGNPTNLHWFALWLTPWLLLARPRTLGGAAGLAVAALLAALTEPQVLLFAPLVLLRPHGLRQWLVRGALLVGGVVQFGVAVAYPRVIAGSEVPDLASIVQGWVYWAGLRTWLPSDARAANLIVEYGWWVAGAAVVPFLVVAAWVLWRGTPAQRWLAASFVAASIAMWTVPYVVNRGGGSEYAFTSRWTGADLITALVDDNVAVFAAHRYGVVSSMFLLALLPLAALVLKQRGRPVGAFTVLGVLGVIAVVAFLPRTSDHDGAPDWAADVAAARSVCATADPATVQSWEGWPVGWYASYTCAQLQPGARAPG
ncbi:MAG: hypothetical protein QM604_01240 [Microbacterium sp.]